MKENYQTKTKAIELKKEMAGHFRHPMLEFSCHSSALLVLDMQNFFADSASHAYIPSIKEIIQGISKLIKAFEYHNRPVIFTKHINNAENVGLMGKWWRDIIEKDTIINDFDTQRHTVIEKSQYDAFYNTDLENLLKKNKVENIVITGVMTHLCCETTARSAFVRGFGTFFVIDGTATYNERFHKNSLFNLAHGVSVPVLVEDLCQIVQSIE